MYNVSGMTDKNKDSLIKDLLDLVASSSNSFLQTLFPDRVDPNNKKRPPTAGDRIKVCWYPLFSRRLMNMITAIGRCIGRELDESPTILYSNH